MNLQEMMVSHFFSDENKKKIIDKINEKTEEKIFTTIFDIIEDVLKKD